MKILEFTLLVLCILFIGRAMAMNVTTGNGYYTYNGQVIAYYNLRPGQYPDSDVNAIETSGEPTVAINQTESCRYYQIHNPSINMNCS